MGNEVTVQKEVLRIGGRGESLRGNCRIKGQNGVVREVSG